MMKQRSFRSFWLVLALVVATGLTFSVFDLSPQVSAQNQQDAQTSPADRPIRSVRDLGNVFVDIAAEVRPSVVTVFSERVMRARNPFSNGPFGGFFDEFFGGPRGQQPGQEFRQRGLGSGVVISEDGLIVTNNHVIEGADTIFVRDANNQQFAATVVGADPKTDLAVLRIDTDNLTPIRLGNSDDVQVGEWVIAVGSPLSPDLAQTVTQGIVSAKGRSNVGLADYEDFIQTDAAINPGNSGGPLLNLDGELIGLNTAIATRSGGYQGIGFAVPVNMVRYVMDALIDDGRVVRGWLGVSIQDVTEAMSRALGLESEQGAIIGDVVEDSPADEAGLEAGDVILSLDGRTLENSTELRNRIARIPPGSSVTMTIFREGSKEQLDVELGEQPGEVVAAANGARDSMQDLLGFSVSDIDPNSAREFNLDPDLEGVVVTTVDPVSSAYRAGLRPGDVIRAVNRRAVRSTQEFMSLMSDVTQGSDVLLRIQRESGQFYLAFTV